MYDRSQLMRGTIEGCILCIIRRRTTYGYEIVESLRESGFGDMKEGTIYPLLLRLEKKGFIKARFMPSPLGPNRKYYSLTEDGERLLEEFLDCWRQMEEAVGRVIEGKEGQGGGARPERRSYGDDASKAQERKQREDEETP